jgi:hypothetical protein
MKGQNDLGSEEAGDKAVSCRLRREGEFTCLAASLNVLDAFQSLNGAEQA